MTYEEGFLKLLEVVRIHDEILKEITSDYTGYWWHDKLRETDKTLSEMPTVKVDV